MIEVCGFVSQYQIYQECGVLKTNYCRNFESEYTIKMRWVEEYSKAIHSRRVGTELRRAWQDYRFGSESSHELNEWVSQSRKYSVKSEFIPKQEAVETITNLLVEQKIHPSEITWVISRDMWYILRESMEEWHKMMKLFGENLVSANSMKEGFRALEANGVVVRHNPRRSFPEVCKSAIIDSNDLSGIRSIPKENVVRKGRVTSIEANM